MRPWFAVLCALLASGSARAMPLAPWQGSASLAAPLARSAAQGASFFLGHAWGGGAAGAALPFAALGGELTLSGARGPYDTALGLQLRAGMAWGQAGAGTLWPDLLVFARVAPLVALTALEPRDAAAGRGPPAFGVRLGLGLTASAWTQWLLREAFPEDELTPGFLAEAARVVTGLVLLPLAFLNHVELTVELAGPRGMEPVRLVALRVGSGF